MQVSSSGNITPREKEGVQCRERYGGGQSVGLLLPQYSCRICHMIDLACLWNSLYCSTSQVIAKNTN